MRFRHGRLTLAGKWAPAVSWIGVLRVVGSGSSPSSQRLAVHGIATPPQNNPMSLSEHPHTPSPEPPKTPYDFDPSKWDNEQHMAENGGSEGTYILVLVAHLLLTLCSF